MAEMLTKDYDRITEKTYPQIKDTKYVGSDTKFGGEFKNKPFELCLYERNSHFDKGTCCSLYCILSTISFIFRPEK